MKTFDLSQIPPPPEGCKFRVASEVLTHCDPHPFMIGPRHVEIAADHFGGMLGDAALYAAERQGITCYMKDSHGHRCTLSRADHKTLYALQIVIPERVADLNTIVGLHDYLVSIKDAVNTLALDGVAFPSEEQYSPRAEASRLHEEATTERRNATGTHGS